MSGRVTSPFNCHTGWHGMCQTCTRATPPGTAARFTLTESRKSLFRRPPTLESTEPARPSGIRPRPRGRRGRPGRLRRGEGWDGTVAVTGGTDVRTSTATAGHDEQPARRRRPRAGAVPPPAAARGGPAGGTARGRSRRRRLGAFPPAAAHGPRVTVSCRPHPEGGRASAESRTALGRPLRSRAGRASGRPGREEAPRSSGAVEWAALAGPARIVVQRVRVDSEGHQHAGAKVKASPASGTASGG